MSAPIQFVVPSGVRGARADKLLATAFPERSRMDFQRTFAAGRVLRGGVPIDRAQRLNEGDLIEFSFADVEPTTLKPVDIPLDVLYEDKHLLAVNKPAGMVVHPGAGTGTATLVHALLAHCRGELSGIGGVERPGIVHRLDKETTGVIVVAKTDAAHRGLSRQFAERTLAKEYLALVAGTPDRLSGSIRKPIARNPRQRHKMAVVDEGAKGRDAHTEWSLVERFANRATLLRCTIHTGRTHQIRVHMKSIGHPILGDRTYGWVPDASPAPTRVMLHAEHLAATHPVTGRPLDFRAPLPADFKVQIRMLRDAVPSRRGLQAAAKASATKPQRKV